MQILYFFLHRHCPWCLWQLSGVNRWSMNLFSQVHPPSRRWSSVSSVQVGYLLKMFLSQVTKYYLAGSQVQSTFSSQKCWVPLFPRVLHSLFPEEPREDGRVLPIKCESTTLSLFPQHTFPEFVKHFSTLVRRLPVIHRNQNANSEIIS